MMPRVREWWWWWWCWEVEERENLVPKHSSTAYCYRNFQSWPKDKLDFRYECIGRVVHLGVLGKKE